MLTHIVTVVAASSFSKYICFNKKIFLNLQNNLAEKKIFRFCIDQRYALKSRL